MTRGPEDRGGLISCLTKLLNSALTPTIRDLSLVSGAPWIHIAATLTSKRGKRKREENTHLVTKDSIKITV